MISCMILKKELIFLSMVAKEAKKINFSLIIAWVAISKKRCIQKLWSYRFKLPLEKIGLVGSAQGETKYHKLKNVYFKEKGAKDKSITILLFMSNFHNFAYKLKTGWATRVVKPILKTIKSWW